MLTDVPPADSLGVSKAAMDAGTRAVAAARLLADMRSRLTSMTPSQAKIARFILADPAHAAALGLEALAEQTSTSPATVVRFASTVGQGSFRELRLALALAAGAGETRVDNEDRFAGDISFSDAPLATVTKLALEERTAISDTAEMLDLDEAVAVAATLAAARRIVAVGVGASALVATDLAHKLARIGLTAQAICEGHEALTTALVLRAGDVLVAVSSSGETFDVLEPLRAARERGVTTIALTARAASSITCADHTLFSVSARESELRPAAMASRTGQMFLVDVLFTLVAQRDAHNVRTAVEQSFAALSTRRSSAGSRRAVVPAMEEQ